MSSIVERNSSETPAVIRAMDPMQLLSVAVSQGADIAKLEKLMELQERWEANNARKAFDSAISEARAKIKPIVKTATVDFTSEKGRTHYTHETLDAIATQIDPILSSCGLSYRYRSRQDSGALFITCILSHKDGHSEETELSGPPDSSGNKNSYQAVGSAATYLQRYTLKLALGLSAAQDDDARTAGSSQPATNPELAAKWVTMAAGATNAEALTEIWQAGVKEIQAAKDMPSYNTFKAAVEARGKALKAESEAAKARQAGAEQADYDDDVPFD